ncbi:class I SAM-dependent methyltransferase [Tatumella sp. OPLPL6]|uniref:class I SAM-dependent methyltransferase n=1 Tax=Tatumella sp. OPLPL6 TaxID=1928657 RepID=UPI000C1A0165|nr:class I SAM-dependent methyltransferase [Tatumella sp. OPLPL6]PIJ43288.1 SAM-dependent methyltransferase [Tatumella sp. OPLPL6]
MTMEPQILDMCCGSRMFWLDKDDPRVMFCDVRAETHEMPDRKPLTVSPDVIADFRNLPFPDESFWQVVFDPPHLLRAGINGWMRKKYGKLDKVTWPEDLRQGFKEAFRVLKPNGTLVFKWNETQIRISQILPLTEYKPTVWQRTGKGDKTHWILFIKPE